MAIIEPQEAAAIRTHLERNMRGPVAIDFFREGPGGPEVEAQLCDETGRLLDEVAALSPLLQVRRYRIDEVADLAAQLGVDRVPAAVISGAAKGKLRFLGVPAGFGVGVLLEDILDCSCGDTALVEATRSALASLTEDVRLKVFVTPTCRYCHPMARMAHQMAVESAHVHADVIEASEYPDLVERYQVRGVPTVIINERLALLGLRGENDVLEAMQEALAGEPPCACDHPSHSSEHHTERSQP